MSGCTRAKLITTLVVSLILPCGKSRRKAVVMNSPKYLIAAAALSGLLAGASSRAMAAAPVAPVSSSASVSAGARAMPAINANVGVLLADPAAKHDCKGKNDCKGVGGCKA